MTFAQLRKLLHNKLTEDTPVEVELPVSHTQDAKLDLYSSTWLFVKSWAEAELAKARETNDYFKNDETRTAALRGRIKLLKETLALPGGK